MSGKVNSHGSFIICENIQLNENFHGDAFDENF